MTKTVGGLRFTSELEARHRAVLEELLFFNPNQSLYRDAVVEAIERFGEPRIEEHDGRLRIGTTRLGQVQTLFALELAPDGDRPIGVAVYFRTEVDTMTLIQVVVHPDFAADGPFAEELVTIRLVQEISRAAARIKAIRRVVMPYGTRSLVTIAKPAR